MHSPSAVQRFHKTRNVESSLLSLVREKGDREIVIWKEHVRRFKRIDIIDRSSLDEYLASPEYYQMPLTPDELYEQFAQIITLLEYDNYSLCLTPEAIDLSYELRGQNVRIRTDRRNKGEPRIGRISGVTIVDAGMAEIFAREFWSLFRATEPDFKSKDHVKEWLQGRVYAYASRQGHAEKYDVYMSHTAACEPDVLLLAARLRDEGATVWLRAWNEDPGRPWRRTLEADIGRIAAVGICCGFDGAPWHDIEEDTVLRQFAERGVAMIPIVLPRGSVPAHLPPYLTESDSVKLDDLSDVAGLMHVVTRRLF
jgi:hypothetical protein